MRKSMKEDSADSKFPPRSFFIYGAMVVSAVVLFLFIDAFGERLVAPEAAAETGTGIASSSSDALLHVLIALIAVLLAGRLLGRLFRYVGQPPVIGEVVGGILLGPSLLGWVWPDAAEFILPPSVAPYLGVISQLGVILYMFVVGLELNAGMLQERAGAAVLISHT